MTEESKLAAALSTTLRSDEAKALVAEYAEVGLVRIPLKMTGYSVGT